jgi:hypothetical protein
MKEEKCFEILFRLFLLISFLCMIGIEIYSIFTFSSYWMSIFPASFLVFLVVTLGLLVGIVFILFGEGERR